MKLWMQHRPGQLRRNNCSTPAMTECHIIGNALHHQARLVPITARSTLPHTVHPLQHCQQRYQNGAC